MAVDPRCLVAVADFADGRYVQFWIQPDGDVSAEVVSNLNIGDAVALSERDEESLRAQGWREPTGGPRPNWSFDSHDVAGLIRTVSMVRHAVYEVLGERPGNSVALRSWKMAPNYQLTSDEVQEMSRTRFQEAVREIARQLDDE